MLFVLITRNSTTSKSFRGKKFDFIRIYFSASNTCPDKWFECGNGQCIPVEWQCDGEQQCRNSKDEQNCGMFDCFHKVLKFLCATFVNSRRDKFIV